MENIDITPIIVAVITSVGGVLGAYLAVRKNNKENAVKEAQREQKQQDTLEDVRVELVDVKKRLDKHNGYAEMFNNNQKNIELLQKDVYYIKERLNNIDICRIK